MTKRFAAAVLRSYESRFTVEEVTLGAGPADGEILVRIAGCGMCRTDLAVRRSAGRSPLPAVLGHEGPGSWWRRAARTPASASATMSC
ncbi:hypothetical protein SANT12839_001830 [Streptomyces antimycoticus]|uniref:Alcohol dehydrogenase-like N-terminal domain-containing protein n=1 Tax=Streptomyces antimycoticus TaxID=68175 RepID=A0A4D4JRE8_9ACTN|nr:hypothetical protein SANT12839_001830 [Streptomyces antimycoticus]